MSGRKNLLVIGATGKQGRGLIRSLLDRDEREHVPGLHVLALTRDTSSPSARQLVGTGKGLGSSDRITLVKGDLDSRESIRTVFEAAAVDGGGIWGVFVALAYPGLGANADAEVEKGKMLADLALEFHVQVFIYSSSLHAGLEDDPYDASHLAKRRIEGHCRDLGQRGLNWVILRPGFFMENFAGTLGAVAAGVLGVGLGKDTTICLIASEDIGRVAAGVLQNHKPYHHKTLSLTSEAATMENISESHKAATGKAMPAIPATVARLILKFNSETQNIVREIEHSHQVRAGGKDSSFEQEVDLAKSVCALQTYREWRANSMKGEPQDRNWNKVSLLKLLTGRS